MGHTAKLDPVMAGIPYKGWDPEFNRDNSGAITQGASYLGTPQARVYSLGFNFGL